MSYVSKQLFHPLEVILSDYSVSAVGRSPPQWRRHQHHRLKRENEADFSIHSTSYRESERGFRCGYRRRRAYRVLIEYRDKI